MSAIYHFSAQIISRSSGRSAVAAAAYRAAEKMVDERISKSFDYTKKLGVFRSEIMLPSNAPTSFQSREVLWNEVEKAEKRKDAQLAREIDIALPRCLNNEQKIILANAFIKDTFVKKGMIADVCFHDLDSDNPHVHVMLTTREVDENGLGKKNRQWNNRDLLIEWREKWATYANTAMQAAGHNLRIDHRTLKAQGIDREPQVHLGPQRHAMQKKGIDLYSLEPQKQHQIKRRAEQAAADKVLDAQLQARDFVQKAHITALEKELIAARHYHQNLLNNETEQREKAERLANAQAAEPSATIAAAHAFFKNKIAEQEQRNSLIYMLTRIINNNKILPKSFFDLYDSDPLKFFQLLSKKAGLQLTQEQIQAQLLAQNDELNELINYAERTQPAAQTQSHHTPRG